MSKMFSFPFSFLTMNSSLSVITQQFSSSLVTVASIERISTPASMPNMLIHHLRSFCDRNTGFSHWDIKVQERQIKSQNQPYL